VNVPVTVAVYVPAGVPGIFIGLDPPPPPPPQADRPNNNTAIIGIARTGIFRRQPKNNKPEASRIIVQRSGIIPGGSLACEIDPAVPGAVVEIFAVAAAAVPSVTLTDDGTVHNGAGVNGAGVTAGVIAQLRLTVPLNDPAGVTARLKDAVCPAAIVAEFEDPDAGPMTKSGTAAPVPESAIICGLPAALSVILIEPVRLPAAVGVNVTDIWQLLPAASEVLQELVSPKSPEAAMLVMLSGPLPVFVSVTT
jgi:hypothetical protein